MTYNGSYALSSPVEFYDYLADYSRALTMQMRSAATGNKSTSFQQGYGRAMDGHGLGRSILSNTDQYDEMFRTGCHHEPYGFRPPARNDKINSYTSLGIMDREGLQITMNTAVITCVLNVDYKVRDNVKIGIERDGSWSERQTPRGARLENCRFKNMHLRYFEQASRNKVSGAVPWLMENLLLPVMLLPNTKLIAKILPQKFNGSSAWNGNRLRDLKLNVSYALRYYNQFSKKHPECGEPDGLPDQQYSPRTMPDTGDIISNSNNEGHKTLFQGRITYERGNLQGGIIFPPCSMQPKIILVPTQHGCRT